jgi:hypothetical protein
MKLKYDPFRYACHFPRECDYLSKFQFTTHSYEKNHFFGMKNFKLLTWYSKHVQIMWNDMVQYTFNFHKNYKSFKLFLKCICVVE